MNKSSLRSLLLFLFLLLITPMVVLGQNTEELCRAFINRAFGDLGNNCANLASDEVCYGYGDDGQVKSTFYVDGEAQVIQEDSLSEASDRVSLIDMEEASTLESLETQAFSLDRDNDGEEESLWGLAMLEVPANLPQQLEKNSAVYIVFGGSRIENNVFPDDAVKLNPEALPIVTNDDVALYTTPEDLGYSIPSQVIGTVSGALEADAISPDGQWLRVFYTYERRFGERTTAWVRVTDLAEEADLVGLPIMGPDSFTPMQSLYLSNDFSQPECDQVPAPGLLVQGPNEIETDFTINDMPVRVTSTAYFRQISERRLQVFALTGFTVLFPDSDDESVIPAGFTQVLCLTEARDLGIDGEVNDHAVDLNCSEGGPRPFTGDESAGLEGIASLPDNVVNYEFGLPSITCPSGIGTPSCTIRLPAPALARIRALCNAGVLPANICDKFGF